MCMDLVAKNTPENSSSIQKLTLFRISSSPCLAVSPHLLQCGTHSTVVLCIRSLCSCGDNNNNNDMPIESLTKGGSQQQLQ